MAQRSRAHREEIPGYGAKPSRDDRRLQHRATRHAANQALRLIDDPDEVVLPETRSTKAPVTPTAPQAGPEPRRFRVWKTKFWKRRYSFKDEKLAMDAEWPVITPDQLPD